MNITISVPDDIEMEFKELPNAHQFAVEALREKMKGYRQKTTQKGKWAKIAERIHKESPLHGLSDELNKSSREFRDNFSFKHDE